MTTSSKSPLHQSLLAALRGACVGALLHVFIDAEPRPRAIRIMRGRIGYSEGYYEFYAACRQQLAQIEAAPSPGPVVAACEFVMPKAKSTKRAWPSGDVDNLVKAPLDATTKVERVWNDDDQVLTAVLTKRYAEPGEQPGVHIHYGYLPNA